MYLDHKTLVILIFSPNHQNEQGNMNYSEGDIFYWL